MMNRQRLAAAIDTQDSDTPFCHGYQSPDCDRSFSDCRVAGEISFGEGGITVCLHLSLRV